jgi:hypothetical protein
MKAIEERSVVRTEYAPMSPPANVDDLCRDDLDQIHRRPAACPRWPHRSLLGDQRRVDSACSQRRSRQRCTRVRDVDRDVRVASKRSCAQRRHRRLGASSVRGGEGEIGLNVERFLPASAGRNRSVLQLLRLERDVTPNSRSRGDHPARAPVPSELRERQSRIRTRAGPSSHG